MQEVDTDPEQEAREKLYAQSRDDLLKRLLSNDENFDRSVLTLASAALATSVAFIRGMDNTGDTCYLTLSWCAMVTAIISTLVSYLASKKAIYKQIELNERYYLNRDDSALIATNWYARITDFLAYVSAIAFVAGIVLLLLYFNCNLSPIGASNA